MGKMSTDPIVVFGQDLVGHIRISSKYQTGLPGQRDFVENFCRANHANLVGVMTDRQTGTLLERDGLFAAMMMIKNGEAAGLVVPRLDRLGRLTPVIHGACERVYALGGIVCDARANKLWVPELHASPGDQLEQGMRVLLAVHDRSEFLDDMNRRKDTIRAKDPDRRTDGIPRYGYACGGNGTTVENWEEQLVIQLMEEMRRNGWSYNFIAYELNLRKIPTRKGKQWSAYGVQRILDPKTRQKEKEYRQRYKERQVHRAAAQRRKEAELALTVWANSASA